MPPPAAQRARSNNSTGNLAAEAWAPATEAWTTLAPMAVPRLYHSTALLLPDGRVLATGGGLPPGTGGRDVSHQDAQVFSPPYLYRGPRPVITSVPSEVAYGEAFLIETLQPADIAAVRWIRLSSVTHAFNENQRSNVLPFTVTRAGLFATTPRDSNLCPPGHYLLFILSANGVPSQGRVVHVTRPAARESAWVTTASSCEVRARTPRDRMVRRVRASEDGPAELFVYDHQGWSGRAKLAGLAGAHTSSTWAGRPGWSRACTCYDSSRGANR